MIVVKVVFAAFGILSFTAHMAWAIYAVRRCEKGDDKLEAAGIAIPGISGVLLAAMTILPLWWSLACLVLAVANLALGRAVYELWLFRRHSGRQAEKN